MDPFVALHPVHTGALTFWNTWTFDPLTVAGLSVLLALYTRGLWRSRGRSGSLFPWWRPTSFYVGWTALLLGAVSPIDGLSSDLFLMHMVQHMLLMMVGPPLVLLGAPVVPLLRGLPGPLRTNLAIPLLQMRRVRKVLGLLASPLIAWLAFVFTLWVWHVPSLYNEAVSNEALHFLQHAMFMGAATLFWWIAIDPVPLRPRLSYGLRLLYLFLATLQSTALAAMITLTTTVLYTYYEGVPRLWGLTPAVDQMIAGLIMWIPGAAIYFIALSVLFFVLLARDNDRMRRLEGREVKAPRRW